MIAEEPTLEQIEEQLSRINTLLSDATFMLSLAAGQAAAYYTALGKTPPAFPLPGEIRITKNVREEKIAFHLTGLYAIECSIGAFMAQEEAAPIHWLQQIMQGRMQADHYLLLQCFASATYHAGQAFYAPQAIRSMELPPNSNELMATATYLLNTLQALPHHTPQAQLQKIVPLLKDPSFALELAQYLEKADPLHSPHHHPTLLADTGNDPTVERKALDEHVAINVAGAYALEAGLTYLGYSQNKLPSQVINALLADQLSTAQKELLERFAHATWMAGQPFRGLDRITRPVFMHFDLLSAEERDKDWTQVKAAAASIAQSL
jgi:hypothetical protein